MPQRRSKGRTLDQDLYLIDPNRPELGADTILGSFQLPLGAFDQSILDQTSYLDKGLRLG